MGQVGMVDAVIARETEDGGLALVDGHLRADIAGDDTVPVIVVDLNAEEAEFVLATHDSVGSMAEVDTQAALSLIADLTYSMDRRDDLDELFTSITSEMGVAELLEIEGPQPPPFDDPSWADSAAETVSDSSDAETAPTETETPEEYKELSLYLQADDHQRLLSNLAALRNAMNIHNNGKLVAEAVEAYAKREDAI